MDEEEVERFSVSHQSPQDLVKLLEQRNVTMDGSAAHDGL